MSFKNNFGAFAEPPIPASEIGPRHIIHFDDYEMPGMVFLAGGEVEDSIKREQELYSFRVRNIYQGHPVDQWQLKFLVWTYEQYREAVRLFNVLSPKAKQKFTEFRFHNVANPYMNEHDFRVGLITKWKPFNTPERGKIFVYEIHVNGDYPLAWPTKKADKAAPKPPDMPQNTDAAIFPEPEDAINQSTLTGEQWWEKVNESSAGRGEPGHGFVLKKRGK